MIDLLFECVKEITELQFNVLCEDLGHGKLKVQEYFQQLPFFRVSNVFPLLQELELGVKMQSSAPR